MCGISGFLAPPTRPHEDLVQTATAMADSLRHRGPDDEGVWVDPAAGIGFGFRRLAIIDLSVHGRQPMTSARGRYVIELNGEIYNFQELRRELEEAGHRFRGHSDVEVALAVIERDGLERALAQFNGMFALALWDRERRTLALARDRFGEKPLYYGWSGSTFLFGSELKALRRHPAFVGEIDRDAVAHFFRLSYVPCPLSIYRNVSKLPPGCLVEVKADEIGRTAEPRPYWSAADTAVRGLASPFHGTEREAADELDRLLRRAVALRMLADVPLGAFLSGGIDSSTVVALMQAQSPVPVRTFTIGFDEAGHDESANAKAVANHLGTDHTELFVRPAEALAVIPRLPQLFDEPFADSSQVPTFAVASMARRYVTVALSGDGGDELFGGYNRYAWGHRVWNAVGWAPRGLREVSGRGLRGLSPPAWDRTLEAIAAVVPRGWRVRNPGEKLRKLGTAVAVASPAEMYDALVAIWRDPAEVVIGGSIGPLVQWSAGGPDERDDVRQWMMYRDVVSYLPDDILAKVDRASMGTSLEARVPFLDPDVYAFAWRLPLSMKIRGGQGKWLLRRVLERYVPSPLFERPKMGFGVPIGEWLRGPLRDWADSLLDESRLRREGYLEPGPIRSIWEAHRKGQADWQHQLWAALMFQAWLGSSPLYPGHQQA